MHKVKNALELKPLQDLSTQTLKTGILKNLCIITVNFIGTIISVVPPYIHYITGPTAPLPHPVTPGAGSGKSPRYEEPVCMPGQKVVHDGDLDLSSGPLPTHWTCSTKGVGLLV